MAINSFNSFFGSVAFFAKPFYSFVDQGLIFTNLLELDQSSRGFSRKVGLKLMLYFEAIQNITCSHFAPRGRIELFFCALESLELKLVRTFGLAKKSFLEAKLCPFE